MPTTPPAPWPVFDEKLLTEVPAEILRHEAHGDIRDATRAVRNNDAHRLRGVSFGPR